MLLINQTGYFDKRSSVKYDTLIKWITLAAKEELRQIAFEFAQLVDSAGISSPVLGMLGAYAGPGQVTRKKPLHLNNP